MTTLYSSPARYCSKPGCTNRLMHPDSLAIGTCLAHLGVMNRYYHCDGERGGAEWPSQEAVAYVVREDFRTNPHD